MKQQTYTSTEMIKMTLPEGHIFKNIAENGKKPKWIIVPFSQIKKEREADSERDTQQQQQ